MQILLTGGTGFIGLALQQALLKEGHSLTILTRQTLVSSQAVKFIRHISSLSNLNDFDAVINLAGEPIFAKRWSEPQKQILQESRLQMTQQLVRLFQASTKPPAVFLSGSATGFYGDLPQSSHRYDESAPTGSHFSAKLCQMWEDEALKAAPYTRLCLLRTGLVLAPNGGALKQMLPLYRWHLAGPLGNGKQHWAWIALSDYVQAAIFLLKNANCRGTFNLVAPHPVSNREFTQLLAGYLQRCAYFTAPEWGLKLALGERSQILLDNQPLIPKKLLQAGFQFGIPTLDFSRILVK